MKSWDIAALPVEPRAPQILSTPDDGRAIVLVLPAGEQLKEHQVHERAWVFVVAGEVEVEADAERVSGGPGLLLEFAPNERHEVTARADSRLLLLLTPWPGDGHPGAMTLDEKSQARARAAAHRS
jgi:quercetin dioxygenase-like cupin family protein